MKSPIRKPLVLTNQSVFVYLTYYAFKSFELKNEYTRNMYEIKSRTMFEDIAFSNFSSFFLKVNLSI